MATLEKDDLERQIEKYYQEIATLLKVGKITDSWRITKEIMTLCEKLENWEAYIKVRNKIGEFSYLSKNITEIEETEAFLLDTMQLSVKYLGEYHEQIVVAHKWLGYWYTQIMKAHLKAKFHFETNLQFKEISKNKNSN